MDFVNFDESPANSFAVYDEGLKMINREEEGTNIVVSRTGTAGTDPAKNTYAYDTYDAMTTGRIDGRAEAFMGAAAST